MTPDDLERIADEACIAELEARRMRRLDDVVLELDLVVGIKGRVGLLLEQRLGGRKTKVLVTPQVGVQHEEAARVVSHLRGLAPGDPVRLSMGTITRSLIDLVPGATWPRLEWAVGDADSAPDAARRVADDVVFYGFPHMERLRTTEAVLAEMIASPKRLLKRFDVAVLSMLVGQPQGARDILMVPPLSHNPTIWGNGYEEYTDFLRQFSTYFGIDLEVEKWPLREPKRPRPVKVNIRDKGVVRDALSYIGRSDLALRAEDLTDDHLQRIGQKTTDIRSGSGERDPLRAIGMAAVSVLEGLQYPWVPEDTLATSSAADRRSLPANPA